ncbi:uncharacterized membrane protein YcaP (DUF421 family) [Clostridium sardiniense]|nr:uncharacterized membrane protein YcaP (DUF421 family) [Clostridium sardiniense]
MFIVFIRTAILYALVVLVMRLMGKRQIGELQPYEFVITIMISDLASLPMQDTRLPLLLGVVPILTLLLLKIFLSQLQLKSQFTRKIIEGEPSILIYKSRINYKALKGQQINIDELMEEIRLLGYFDLEEIQYAILETNGHISVLPNSSSGSSGGGSSTSSGNSNSSGSSPNSSTSQSGSQSSNPKLGASSNNSNNNSSSSNSSNKKKKSKSKNNSNTNSSNSSNSNSGNSSNNNSSGNTSTNSNQPLLLPRILISDGKINKNSLTRIGEDKAWIENKLKEYGIDSIKKVLIALYDTQGNFKYQLFDKYEKESKK